MKRRLPVLFTLLLAVPCAWTSCSVNMPGRSFDGPLPALGEVEAARAQRLAAHIDHLAVDIGERNLGRAPAALAEAETWLTGELEATGLSVVREVYEVEGIEVANLVAERSGNDEIVVVGAHYDSAPGTPGADDNASGVAALLAIAAELPADTERTVRFVLFTNEEPPWFHGPEMGSRQHAQRTKERGDNVVAMLSLETLAYYRDEPGTQHYPKPFSALYPSEGNFVGFVGNVASRGLVRRSVASFREHGSFPSEGAAIPASIQGVGWSDHRSFWEQGYPAVMVTDTAPNRNPHYHEPTDLPQTLDVDRLSRVVTGLIGVVHDLANNR